MIVGCSKSGNPVGLSDTQSSGTLQYTFSTANATYKSGDMLTANVTVVNKDSAAVAEIFVNSGDFHWELYSSSGDSVMGGGLVSLDGTVYGTTNTYYLSPGQGKQIYYINQQLISASGQPVPSGLYQLTAWVFTENLLFRVTLRVQ